MLMLRDEMVSLSNRRPSHISGPSSWKIRYGFVPLFGQTSVVHLEGRPLRRILGGFAAFLAVSATLLVLPVYAAPLPDAEPVAPSLSAVDLGSVDRPEDAAVVTTDGAVVDAGPDAAVPPPPPGETGPTASPAVSDEVAASGDETDGIPALTVSRPKTDRFSSVGVTWALDDAVTAVTVQVRTKNAAGRWFGWTPVGHDDLAPSVGGNGPPGPHLPGGTGPPWAREAPGLAARAQAPA